MISRTILVCAFLGLFTYAARCQSLVTDRPDFTESPVVVPRRTVQIESGITAEFANRTRTTSGPELLIRWGLLDQLELRIGSPDFVFADGVNGAGDPTIGAKVALGSVGRVKVGVIAGTSLPAGDKQFGSSRAEPSLLLTGGGDFGPMSIGTQVEGVWGTEADRMLFAATLVAGTALGETAGTFVEIAVAEANDGPLGVLLHGGATVSVADLVQLDIHVGFGASDSSPDFLVGAGLSVRR